MGMNLLAIFIGGGIGSLARFGVSLFFFSRFRSLLPWGTLVANGLACIVLAFVLTRYAEVDLERPLLRPLLVIGFCGGFSTFSTFSYETLELIRTGNTMYAVANVLVSVLLCLGLIYFVQKVSTL